MPIGAFSMVKFRKETPVTWLFAVTAVIVPPPEMMVLAVSLPLTGMLLRSVIPPGYVPGSTSTEYLFAGKSASWFAASSIAAWMVEKS